MADGICIHSLNLGLLKGISAISTTGWSCLALWCPTGNSFALRHFSQKPRVNLNGHQFSTLLWNFPNDRNRSLCLKCTNSVQTPMFTLNACSLWAPGVWVRVKQRLPVWPARNKNSQYRASKSFSIRQHITLGVNRVAGELKCVPCDSTSTPRSLRPVFPRLYPPSPTPPPCLSLCWFALYPFAVINHSSEYAWPLLADHLT